MKGPRFFRALQLCCSCSQVALKSDESSAEADSWQSFNVISFSPSIWNIRRPFRKKVSVIMVFSEHKPLLKADEHGLAIIFRNDRSWGPFGAARLGAALRSLISAWRRHPGRAGSWEFQAVNVRAEFDTLCARPSRLGRRTQIRAPQEIVAEWVNPPVILAPKMVHVKCFKTLEDVNYVYTWCPLVMTSD